MKITILHQDLEWSETAICNTLAGYGHQAILADIRETEAADIADSGLVLNRIYASVANRNYRDNLKCLRLLKELESLGITCINSWFTSRVDYSKHLSWQLLASRGIPTPETVFIKTPDDTHLARRFADRHGFPLVIKRDLGGRALDILLLANPSEMDAALEHFFGESYQMHYDAGFILQTYHRNIRDYDCRIAVIDGQYAYAYKRSLIANSDTEPAWIGSLSRGSESGSYRPDNAGTELAVLSTRAIQSLFNEVDIIFTETGPMVIENNPTPVFFADRDREKLESAVRLILKSLAH